MQKALVIVGRPVGIGLLVLGAGGWFSPFLFFDSASGSTEFPLGDLASIAVDRQGRIFCGIVAYGRIQMYDSDGRFVRGWPVGSSGGAFRIRMNRSDQVDVAVTRGDRLHTFDDRGNLLNTKERFDILPTDRVRGPAQTECRLPTGDVYSIRGGLLFPHVVKRDGSGRRTTVVRMTFAKWLIMCPFPAGIFLAVAVVIHCLIQWSAKKSRSGVQSDGSNGEGAAGAKSLGFDVRRGCGSDGQAGQYDV